MIFKFKDVEAAEKFGDSLEGDIQVTYEGCNVHISTKTDKVVVECQHNRVERYILPKGEYAQLFENLVKNNTSYSDIRVYGTSVYVESGDLCASDMLYKGFIAGLHMHGVANKVEEIASILDDAGYDVSITNDSIQLKQEDITLKFTLD